MLRVYACITQDHDTRLVAVAALICLLAAFTAMSLRQRAVEAARPLVRLWWLTGTAVVAGAGIWSTHFVAMLAFKPNMPIGYDLGLTTLSIVAAIAIAWVGHGIAIRWPRQAALGGAVAGAAIGSMHYIGMGAMRVPAVVVWDAAYVVASVAIGIALGAAALWTVSRAPALRSRLLGAGIFALGICGMHFTAMAAASLEPDSHIPLPERMIEPGMLVIAIAAVTIIIVVLGLAGSIVDRLHAHVSELQTMKRRLEESAARMAEALEAAEAAKRAKSDFLAAMSHELRTPLNAVLGFSEMLEREPFGALGNPRYREYVEHIRTSGSHLLRLISDVLEFSKAEAGALTLDETEIDLETEISAVLASLAAIAAKGGLALESKMARDLPRLRADGRRVRQILLNLLSNAIKFTSPGGTVRVHAFAPGRGISIAVSDTGIGMAPAEIAKAFERFRQVDSHLSRRYEGAGLGLPLTKQFVELHGGTIELASAPGKGTTATVAFPDSRVLASEGVCIAA